MKTNKNILNIGLCALLALALPGMAAAQQMKTLSGHVPRPISRFHLQAIGALPADTNLTLAISLPPQNETNLDSLLSQIYDPTSTNYHHYLKPGEFVRRFGPSAPDYQKVMDFAKANNLAIVRAYSNQMLLDVSGKASDIENAFHVKLRTYHHPTENRIFFAPDTDPTLDSSVPIFHVSGLDNYFIPRPMLKATALKDMPAGAKPGLGSGPVGLYMGNDFRAAYAPGVTLDGKGQKIALYELDAYYPQDILAYESQAGLPNLTLTNISVNGGVPQPQSFLGNLECSLDIDMVIAMATNASEVLVYEAPNGYNASYVGILNRMASDDLANQISSSWLIGDDPAFDVYYKQMALQGQTFFQASGDNGAYYSNDEFTQQWADDTNITLVGGTTLSTTGPQGPWSSETVWNQFSEGVGTDSSGGGTNWNGVPIPSWQQNVGMTNNQGSTTLRNVPDVSLTADNIYIISDNGIGFGVVGTSAAASLWAGFTALVNEEATNRNMASVGFLNPAIYAIGQSANYTNCFHDITTGNNTNLVAGKSYFAVPGYDLTTGWGTPNGSNLINALTATVSVSPYTHLAAPAPPYGATLPALNGSNPNGNWELFVLDDEPFNSGSINNGWILSLTTANPIGYVADDDVTMTAPSTGVLTNTDITFTIGVTNYGPDISSNVVVIDYLPSGFTFITKSSTLGTVTNSPQGVIWNVTSALGVNSGAQMNLTAQAPNAQEEAENSAFVTSGTPDPNPADSSASVIVNVTVPAPPLLTFGNAGSAGTFNLAVLNSQLPVVIQSSTNLVNWVNIATNTPPFTNSITITPGVPSRFYRAMVQ